MGKEQLVLMPCEALEGREVASAAAALSTIIASQDGQAMVRRRGLPHVAQQYGTEDAARERILKQRAATHLNTSIDTDFVVYGQERPVGAAWCSPTLSVRRPRLPLLGCLPAAYVYRSFLCSKDVTPNGEAYIEAWVAPAHEQEGLSHIYKELGVFATRAYESAAAFCAGWTLEKRVPTQPDYLRQAGMLPVGVSHYSTIHTRGVLPARAMYRFPAPAAPDATYM